MREAINLDRGFSPCFYRTLLRPTCGSAFLRPALGSVQPSLIILLVLFISAFIILDSHDCSWLVNELSRPWWFMWLSPMQLTKADANPVPSLRHVWLLRTTSRAYDKAPLNIHANHKGKTHVLVCLLYCILLLYSRLAQQSCVCTCVSWHHMELEHDVTITAPYCSRSLLTPHLRPLYLNYPHPGCNHAFCKTRWEGQLDQLPLPLVNNCKFGVTHVAWDSST